ncbi:MAG: GatB/YqeY domain-containing protein [Gammaproteobacteria bacterium]|nr:GatB/YqeY domain-containing protein [Gammaproteobacteria bacterium]MYF53685.1 GatB/YqeY domain-containing protein [Gammaproteobacteria bacterium]MYK42613.1 GatB/YqeY domain-containing protein [Gammaproteobacteria bacterium]
MESALLSRIKDATRKSMLARDKTRVAALKLVNAEVKQVELTQKGAVSDTDITKVLSRMVKQRQNSAEQYRVGNRPDLVEQELYEIAVINEFLPKQLTEEELLITIGEVCNELDAATAQDIGRVMGYLSKSLSGAADMSLVSRLVRERLSQ